MPDKTLDELKAEIDAASDAADAADAAALDAYDAAAKEKIND